jgi:O-antigen/teichoic acid export membrane protein
MSQNSESPQSTVNILGGQTIYAAIGSIFTLIVGLPLQIYVTRALGADGIGLFGVVEGVIATISTFLGLGIAPTTIRFLPLHIERKEFNSARTLIFLGVSILLGIGLISYACLMAGTIFLDRWSPEMAEHRLLIAIMGLTMPLGMVIFFCQQCLRGFHDIRYMIMGVSFLQLIIKVVLSVLLLTVGWGLIGYSLAIVLAIICSILWMVVGIIKHLKDLPKSEGIYDFKPDFKQWGRYATISYVGGIVSGLPAYFDRFIIAFLAGIDAVGILVVARRLQQLPNTFTQLLLTVGAPMVAKAHGRDDPAERQHIYNLMTDWITRASLPLLIFLGVLSRPLMSLFGTDFASKESGEVLMILTLGQFFTTVCGPIGTIGIMSGIEARVLRINIVMTGLGFILMFVLTPFFGARGMAVAVAIGSILLGTTLIVDAHRKLGLHWWDNRFWKWFIPAVLTILVALVILNTGLPSGAVALGGYLALLYIVFFGVGLIQGLHEDDMELLKHLFELAGGWVRSDQEGRQSVSGSTLPHSVGS